MSLDQTTKVRFLKFSGIGVIAFLIDVVVFQAGLSLFNASPYTARLVSFVVATSAAWWLNRTFTFRDAENARADLQWARFFAANLVGGSVNYVSFALIQLHRLSAICIPHGRRAFETVLTRPRQTSADDHWLRRRHNRNRAT